MLNLTCIVHSPEVPAAIFWKHNGQVFFLLSYIFDPSMYVLFKPSAPSSHFELRIFCSCSKSATMESRRWPETRCLQPSRSSHLRSPTQGRAESISAGEWKKLGFHLLLLFGFLFLPDKLWVLVEQVFYVFSLFFFSLSFLDRKSIMWIYLHLISVVINKKYLMKLFR